MIRIASRQANKASKALRHRLGAVIVKGGRVLSTGFNEVRYTKELRKPTLHAEEAAILKIMKARRHGDLVGADIYISRVCPSGRVGLAKPCRSCSDLIRASGLAGVFYTTDEGVTAYYDVP